MRAQNPLSARQPACEHRRVLCVRSFVVLMFKFQPFNVFCFEEPQICRLLNLIFQLKSTKAVVYIVFFTSYFSILSEVLFSSFSFFSLSSIRLRAISILFSSAFCVSLLENQI
jgi:hypothetical protein